MWNFYKINDKHFKEFLWNGKLDENLDDILLQFHRLSPAKQFEFMHYVKEKEKYLSIEILQKVFNVDYNDAKSFLTNSYRIVNIPAVDENEGKLVRAILIKGLSSVITNMEHLRSSLETIREFLREGFGAIFEEKFLGESFMLPVAVGLYIERIPENLVFTGKINKEGNIYDVDEIQKKIKLAQKHNLRLVTPIHLSDLKEVKNWLDAQKYDLPFYITKTLDNYKGEFKSFLSSVQIENVEDVLKMLKIFNDIKEEDLLLITGRIKPEKEEWERYAKEFFKRIKRIEEVLEGRELMHFAINGSAAFSLACGMLFGSQKPFYFYHYQNGRYHTLKVENVRYLKERIRNYSCIDYIYEENSDKLAIILAMASHEAEADAKAFTQETGMSYLIVRHKKAGNIPVEEMIEVARETASLIQDIRRERSFKEFHFFLSCPVSIAFMLGVAFGYYSPGYIYNYEKPKYVNVLSIESIREIREEESSEIYSKA